MPRLSVTMSTAVTVLLLSAVAPLARADPPIELLQVEHRRPVGVELSLGVRADQVRGGGFDAFSDDHALAEVMLGASYRVAGSPDAGLTAGVVWNHGSASSTARGSESSLSLDRLSLSLRGQRAVWRRLSVFARLAPGLVRVKAGLVESSAVNTSQSYSTDPTLTQTHWTPALDGAAGAAFRIGELARPREHVFALWLTVEGGYSLARSTQLALASTAGPAPAQTAVPLQLGTITPGGAFLNFAAALTF